MLVNLVLLFDNSYYFRHFVFDRLSSQSKDELEKKSFAKIKKLPMNRLIRLSKQVSKKWDLKIL